MQNRLLSGIPSNSAYKALIKSEKFREMEKFSENFLSVNKKFLGRYARRWVSDPLHQWSRQWEYPYAFSQIESVLQPDQSKNILDAGSGITFFPYFIKSLCPAADICCVDNDPELENIYQRVNDQRQEKVYFSCSDLKALPFAPEQFDAIYCVSVLEHTDDYSGIIQGFYKILKPGGKLVITFDLSLEGTRDISVEKGTQLLTSLTGTFEDWEATPLDLHATLLTPDVFTTHTAKEIDPNLLPWTLPRFVYRFNAFMRGASFGTWPPLLTVFCLSLGKKST